MRFGKRSLDLPFAITVEDRTAEHEEEHRDGEDARTQGSPRVEGEPPQRRPPATLHRSFVNSGF
jgi:hypothetical protein